MMRIIWAGMLLFLFAATGFAQGVKNNPETGRLSLGMRTTFSTFNQGNFNHNGMGVGGHFRLRFSPKINTEWYADYITNDIGGQAKRVDGHIGWSVMYYPFYDTSKTNFLQPYVLAGHCFDYTKISALYEKEQFGERWSSAVQMGLGMHFNITDRTDISLTGQYMIHLGNDMHVRLNDNAVIIEENEGANLESHLLFTLSVNYKLIELW